MTGLTKTVSLFDRIFDEASCDKYYLSIRIRPDGLFYSVFDSLSNKYIAFEAILLAGVSEIYNYIEKHPFIKKSFLKKSFIIPTSKYTLIPAALFVPGKEDEYYNFSQQLSVREQIKEFPIINNEARMVYASESTWFQIYNDHFADACLIPASAAFIDFIYARERNSKTSNIFLNLNDDNFDLLIINDGKMTYCNNFQYKSDQDVVYYTIFVIDQLRIDTERFSIKLSGQMDAKSPFVHLLRKYIRNVELLNYEDDVTLSYALSDVQLHSYSDLFNPMLCVL